MIIAGYLLRVRFKADKVHPDYVSGYLNSHYGKALLRNMGKGIIGMANINATEFKNIKILLPPIELQLQFSTIMEKFLSVRGKILQNISPITNNLFESLLHNTLTGNLNIDDNRIFEYTLGSKEPEEFLNQKEQLELLVNGLNRNTLQTRDAYEYSRELLFSLLDVNTSGVKQQLFRKKIAITVQQ
jgi:restriction endonuclease S subunit